MESSSKTRLRFRRATVAVVAAAQHDGHGAPAKPTPARVATGDCAARARESLKLLDAAGRRIEEARQTNNPAKIRAAVEELQRDLGEIRARLSSVAGGPSSPTPSVTGATSPRGDKPTPIP
jgi:hypothetical protein